MAERILPAPGLTPETEAFVAAAREGRFLLPHCDDCGRTHWYPRAVCPHCWSTRLTWRPASGREASAWAGFTSCWSSIWMAAAPARSIVRTARR